VIDIDWENGKQNQDKEARRRCRWASSSICYRRVANSDCWRRDLQGGDAVVNGARPP